MRKVTYVLMGLLALVLITGCTGKEKRQFNRLLTELAEQDHVIDASDWKKISVYLNDNKTRFSDFYRDNRLDEKAVEDYISKFFEHHRPSFKVRFVGVGSQGPMVANFYLERSGSMVPYDSSQGDGSFKAAIVNMLNSLPGSNNRMFVVNDGIYPYPKGIRQFIANNNIFSSTQGFGDASYTDFAKIFDQLLNKTGDNEISILVTDLIYSTRSMAGVSAQKVFSDAEGMISAVFKDATKQKAMLVIRMNGSYNGPYYSFDSPLSGKPYSGQRPYYIVIVGNNNNIDRLTEDMSYQAFSDFSRLRGYEGMCLFAADGIYQPYCSFLLSGRDVKGRFRPEHGQGDCITRLEDVEPQKGESDVQLALAVDLSHMLIDERYLTDVNNYEVVSDDAVTLKSCRPLTSADKTPSAKKYLGSATHLFVLNVKSLRAKQDVVLRLKNQLPSWVTEGSCDDDRQPDSRTTFGLKYLMQGIYKSYTRGSSAPYYFELRLSLE